MSQNGAAIWSLTFIDVSGRLKKILKLQARATLQSKLGPSRKPNPMENTSSILVSCLDLHIIYTAYGQNNQL